MTDLLTARTVADRLGLSAETVLRWARQGRLPAVYLSNRAIRFREDELTAWLEQRATPGRGDVTQPVPDRRPLGTVVVSPNPTTTRRNPDAR
jgi:excisionase family DNA binding protein